MTAASTVEKLLALCLNGGTRFQKHDDLRAKIDGILAGAPDCRECDAVRTEVAGWGGSSRLPHHVIVRRLNEQVQLFLRDRDEEVWAWTGVPEEDDLESLACPVLIGAEDIRALVRAALPPRFPTCPRSPHMHHGVNCDGPGSPGHDEETCIGCDVDRADPVEQETP